jgi:VanZ family protein
MAVIFYGSSQRRVEVSSNGVINFLFFKTLHILEYAFLYILLFRAFRQTGIKKKKNVWSWYAFILTILYAGTDEIHQTFIPTREGKIRDVIIDAGGALITWISIDIIVPRLPQKLQKLVKI